MAIVRFFVVLSCLLIAAAAFGSMPAKADTCEAVSAKFAESRTAGDLEKAVAAYTQLVDQTTACNEHIVHCAGDSVARAYVEAGYAAADRGAKPADVRGLLEKGRSYGSPWQLLVGLGDMNFAEAHSAKSATAYEQAASLYQDALNVISEEPACADFGEPPPPAAAAIEPIHKRMTEALLLAPQFDVVRTRDGGCGGIFLASIRGFTPTFRPIPINFVFGEATFTPEGDKAVSVLLSCVKQENYTRVVLSGHTDPIGTDSYNMALSKRRLDAVAAYLRAGGYSGKLELLPKGESEPFQADDPTAYSQDEINQLNRRVVLRETDK